MEDRLTHFLMHCSRNRDCEGAKNHYIVYCSPVCVINILGADSMQARYPTHWVKSALRMGVVIESFHAMYTLTQKRLKVMVSTDKAIMKSQKYAKWMVRMSNQDIGTKRWRTA